LFSLDRMRLPKFRYTILAAAILGAVIPVVITALLRLRILHMAGGWDLFLWPSSFMLMATENLGYSPQAFAILAWSIGWNILLYVIVFAVLWSLCWVVRAWRASLHDGTTI
jgi:hypothetical protein